MANDYIYTLAKEILDESVDILSDAGIQVPSRQFVTFGEVVDDCDLVAVSWQGQYTGQPGFPNPQPERQGWARSVAFEIRVIRCVHGMDDRGRGPTVEELNEDGETMLTDMWVLWQGLIDRKIAKTFLTQCTDFVIGNALPVGPEGKVGGGIIPVDVQVN